MSTQIAPLSRVPAPNDPVEVFDANAFAFNVSLETFRTQVNDLALDMQNNADVAAALILGMALPQYAGTSTTSLAIGTGAKSFVTQSGKAWTVGQEVVASNGSAYMKGNVTGYTGTALDVNVTRTSGSGTLGSWTIGLSYKALGLAPRSTRIDVASVAGTVNLTTSAPDTDDIRITGALAITGFTVATDRVLRVVAGGAFTLTNGASLVTQTGANIVCAAGDTFQLRATAANVVEVLQFVSAASAGGTVNLSGNQTIAGVKTFSSMPIVPTQSMVQLNTNGAAAAGYGSTNTAIRRFANVAVSQGTDITYADSASLGASFTINVSGVYAISHSASYGSTNLNAGISLNSTQLSTDPTGVNAANMLAISGNNAVNGATNSSWTGYLASGSVIRPHGNPSANTGSTPSQFSITRVG